MYITIVSAWFNFWGFHYTHIICTLRFGAYPLIWGSFIKYTWIICEIWIIHVSNKMMFLNMGIFIETRLSEIQIQNHCMHRGKFDFRFIVKMGHTQRLGCSGHTQLLAMPWRFGLLPIHRTENGHLVPKGKTGGPQLLAFWYFQEINSKFSGRWISITTNHPQH